MFQFIQIMFLLKKGNKKQKELNISVKKKTTVRSPSEGPGNCRIKLFKSGPLTFSAWKYKLVSNS